MFFREGKKEEMACHGAVIVERLVAKNRIDPASVSCFDKVQDIIKKADKNLNSYVCGNCSFQDEDCDFQSKSLPANCEPCGGYILLAILKDKGMLSSDNIMEACRG
jgi:DNA-directed RNA polymerase subunit RPC12/RpoP